MFEEAFVYDTRLGVDVLREDLDWSNYTPEERTKIAGKWTLMCSGMTNRVSELEHEIMDKYEEMYAAKTEEEMHEINTEVMEIASVICDLNILSRSVFLDLAKAHF